jgi:hypothetical protein
MIVRENDRGTDEDSVMEDGGFVDQGVVLQLAVVSYKNSAAHVGASTDHTVLTEDSVLTHLG